MANSVGAAWVQASCAIVALLATLWLARLTRTYVLLSRQLLAAQTEPQVAIYVRPSARGTPWPELVVENFGGGPAFEVKFDSNWHDLEKVISKDGCDCLKRGIPVLPIRRPVVYDLHEVYGEGKTWSTSSVPVRVSFARAPGRWSRTEHEGVISLEPLTGLGIDVNAEPLRKIATDLQKIRRVMESASRTREDFAAPFKP
ncbi:MAG: hypothetical protein KF678_10375 [Phycisphaeraceae bacterium]|nr:hypothetical protein [Phycisphaeraceae bacterium]